MKPPPPNPRRVIATAAALVLAGAIAGYFWGTSSPRQTLADVRKNIDYDLNAVRENGVVPPHRFLVSLRADLSKVSDLQARKDMFIRILLPHIIMENRRLRAKRAALEKKAHAGDADARKALDRVDIIPTSLALAQGAIESAWGTSRFTREGNAFFGQRTYDDRQSGIVPDGGDGSFKVRTFPTIAAAVRAYMANLNSNPAYADFRARRSALRARGAAITGLALAEHLEPYSERKRAYIESVRQVIRHNNLSDFNAVRLRDFPRP
ncbi:glucosaminidase domain-containing protein [Varunaivibrio sulfuroxidans]|nr:glucosaminidase domain-containing protein [Varunaivibrio sulfuroxidans]WES29903.1 glucosaminidase domain-containing protein [Varunaivibrio sulfuroxidans]